MDFATGQDLGNLRDFEDGALRSGSLDLLTASDNAHSKAFGNDQFHTIDITKVEVHQGIVAFWPEEVCQHFEGKCQGKSVLFGRNISL